MFNIIKKLHVSVNEKKTIQNILTVNINSNYEQIIMTYIDII